ncbi:MAG TPA: DsbA family protein [Bacillales bacterium]|nr:DsbA family protein [Bacillales bacterium]
MAKKKKKKPSKQRQMQKQQQKRREQQPEPKRKMKPVQYLMVGTAAALFLCVVGFALFQNLNPGDGTSEADAKALSLPGDFAYNQYPVMGNPDAPVKIVEFGDYRCPSCKAFDLTIFPEIKKDYISKGKAAFYFVNFPFLGEGSVRAALAAQYVYHHQPDAFWKYHQALYHNQKSEQTKWATAKYLTLLGVEYVPGIQADQLKKAIKQQTYIQAVKAAKQRGVKLGINSTPTIFVNGKEVTPVSKDNLKKAIDQALEKAKG